MHFADARTARAGYEKSSSLYNLDHFRRIATSWVVMDGESKFRVIDHLRTIVDKVEAKAHVPTDNPDLVALRRIVQNRIGELETAEDSNSNPPSNAA